ncbi:MAG: transcriptional regulator [Synechococcaceae cyanobacterium SM2_3_1]|nr:transcriptional regulator [Synechococcaceae cyanobacterium SM2_3_1]
MTEQSIWPKPPIPINVTVARAEQIKAELRMLGWKLVDVAASLEVCRQTISSVLYGKRSRRIEEGIAQILGRPVEEVWPERYPPPHQQISLF